MRQPSRGWWMVIFLAVTVGSAHGAEVASPIRVGDPFYRELQRAELLGLTSGPVLGGYPLSRSEAFRLLQPLAQGVTRAGGATPVPVHPEYGLHPWVTPGLTRARDYVNAWPVFWERGEYPTTVSWAPFRRLELSHSRILGGDRAPQVLDFGGDRSQGISLQREGEFFVEGDHVALAASLRLRLDRDAVTLRPLTLVARGGVGNLRVSVGREPLSWGPERHGGLLLSANARPLNQVRVESDLPWRLPGPLANCGDFHAAWFVGRTGDSGRSDFPSPLLTGSRIAWAPAPWLVLGASRTLMLGGRGNRYPLTWSSAVGLALGGSAGNTDRKDSVDWSLFLWPLARAVPVWDGGRFYGRYASEHGPRNGVPAAPGTTYGLELVVLGAVLRAEASDLTVDGATWYRDDPYPDGYTIRGRVLGHPLDGDARGQAYDMELPLGSWGIVSLGMLRQEKGFFAGDGVFPGAGSGERPQAVQDQFLLGIEKYIGSFPGSVRLEGRVLRSWGDAERLGPLEDWGVGLVWSR